MHQDTIIFQLATHYLSKVALRLEGLYETVDQACEETHPVIHHYALKSVLEIMHLIEKPELKSRFLKELMRIEHTLHKANTTVSTQLSNNLHTQIRILTHATGQFGKEMQQNLFLQSMRLAQPSQHQDCGMHSPQLLFWLKSNPAMRQRDLALWLTTLRTLHSTVNLYLTLLRETAEFDKIDMLNGFYQQPLPAKTSCHLILLRMKKSFGIIPRIQLGHHGLSLRLCEATTMRELGDAHAELDLAICQL